MYLSNSDAGEPKYSCLSSISKCKIVLSILICCIIYHKHKKETPQFPLKRHIKCAYDGTPMTAYTVKKKNLDYYKCNEIGCCNNISAKKLHSLYEDLLNEYSLPKALQELFGAIVKICLPRMIMSVKRL